MEKIGPEILRLYADTLEDKRRLQNIESVTYFPTLNQNLLLSLNHATDEKSSFKDGLPDHKTVKGWIADRLIEANSTDGQTVKLGFFFTALTDFEYKKSQVVTGVFPIYSEYEQVQYLIRPIDIDSEKWISEGKIELEQQCVTNKNPIFAENPNNPDFLFFRQSPFDQTHAYGPFLPEGWKRMTDEYDKYDPRLALEELVIHRAMRYVKNGRWPRLFSQVGFGEFIRKNSSDPAYMELQFAYTQLKRKLYSDYNKFCY